jgi:hypothetical protein
VIVGSVILVAVAAVLLVLGLVTLNDTLLYSSIVGSALAALALIVGVRQLPAARLPEVDFDVRPGGPGPGSWPPRPIGRAAPPPHSRLDAVAEGMAPADLDALTDVDPTVPADEPAEQVVSEREAAAVARLEMEVTVVDGRPRYHVASCLHLLGLDAARLPALEAVELGFTPCALCTPVTVLLGNENGGDSVRD